MNPELDRSRLAEEAKCPVCSAGTALVDLVKTIDPASDERLELRRCRACRHLFHDPIPDQRLLSELYEAGSALVVPRGYRGTSPTDKRQFRRTIRRILGDRKEIEGISVLEIGSGNGEFISWFHARAKRAIGVEPGRWHEGFGFIVPSLANVPSDGGYDIIIALDVMEHLADPIKMLRELRSFAGEAAIISCTFPNADSIAARLLKGRWRMIRPYGHLHYFSAISVEAAFAQSGWTMVRRSRTWFGFSWTPYFVTALRHLAHGRFKKAAGAIVVQLILGRDQWFVQAAAA